MRLLVTTTGSAGHFGPLIPFVEAARDRGAEVLVATRGSSADAVRVAGYDVFAFAEPPAADRDAIIARARRLDEDARNLLIGTEVFAGLDTQASLPGVRAAFAAFAPDVVMHEVGEFSGALVAERERVPRVTVGIGTRSTEQRFIPAVSRRLRPYRAELGLAGRLDSRDVPYFTLAPPALEDAGAPADPSVRRFREHDAAPPPLPDWWGGADAPLVYLTLGSVAPAMGYFPALYRAAIDALADLPVRLLVTTGKTADPADLGPLPANVHAERWVPQAQVMPEAAAMVCHGGFGTVRAALAAGVPMAVLPLFADQPYNARRIAELGAGIALEGGPAAVAGLGDAVRALLAAPGYGATARRAAREIRTLPTVDTAAEVLRELAGG